MGRLSDKVVNDMMDAYFGGTSFTPPSSIFFGMSSTEPNSDGTGITEPNIDTAGYARVEVPNDTDHWDDSTDTRQKTNKEPITFPTATTTGWGTQYYFTMWTTATGTSEDGFLGWGEINGTSGLNVTAGLTPNFPEGSLAIFAPGE